MPTKNQSHFRKNGGATPAMLLKRHTLTQRLRTFFDQQGFCEIQTPLLVKNPGLEPHLQLFQTVLEKGMGIQSKRSYYLPTSPEYHLKKTLALGLEKIFEVTRSFRNAELGNRHQPEFTILEWYRCPGSYQDIARDFERLMKELANVVDGAPEWASAEHITVEEAFQKYAGIDLRKVLKGESTLAQEARRVSIVGIDENDGFSSAFNQIIVEKIEPKLGFKGPTFLWDYPKSEAALSQIKASDPLYCERFEVYWRGIELANAFGELTDPEEQRRRCLADQEERQRLYGASPPLDEEFFAALRAISHPAAGIAVGLDRLFQCLLGLGSLEEVIAFPHGDCL